MALVISKSGSKTLPNKTVVKAKSPTLRDKAKKVLGR